MNILKLKFHLEEALKILEQADAAPEKRGKRFSSALVGQPLGSRINTDVIDGWLKTYTDIQWLEEELIKANNWARENPQKAPKSNWARFYGSWFRRSWEHKLAMDPKRNSKRPETKTFKKEEDKNYLKDDKAIENHLKKIMGNIGRPIDGG